MHKSVLLTLNSRDYWLNVQLPATVAKSHDYDYEDYEDTDIIVVWETAVQPLTDVQRLVFFVMTVLIAFVAIAGNILVLYVNISRKQRFLFRACLISLAVSDLIFIVVTSCIYLPKFLTPNSTLWRLGPFGCSMIPFLQTMAVLVNSILLVCISLDRYMAVSRIIKGSWEPSKVFTVTCCVLIWGFSAAVSSPLLTIYDFYRIYVVPLPDPNEENPVLRYYVAHLCGSDKAENGYFFAIIFSFIFAPLVVTFFWLNSVLAKEVWKRRIDVSPNACEIETSSSAGSTSYRPPDTFTSPETIARRTERRQRQVRMFKVILALMLVFFFCRLPNWVYVLYKLSNDAQGNIFWVTSYGFGLLMMANCMLNPFLYTFLSETIRLTTFLAGIICGLFSPCTKLCKRENTRSVEQKDGFGKKQAFNSM